MAFRVGYVALIGKPNVGKSTLLNHVVGQKVSIVSDKPQTTRRRVVGIANGDDYQIVFIDTPGIHEPHTKLGRAMVESARSALGDVDAIVHVVDASKKPDELDKEIAKLLRAAAEVRNPRMLLCMNKMDLLKAHDVEPNVEAYTSLLGTDRYMMTTATKGHNVDLLTKMILEALPEGEPMFPPDEFTDQPARFLVAELIRERILRSTKQEVPHSTAVVVETWEDESEDQALRIGATIYVEKEGQKAIIIGQKGQFIKRIGSEARAEIEDLLGRHVFLELYVKVRPDWRMNPRMLREMEYTD